MLELGGAESNWIFCGGMHAKLLRHWICRACMNLKMYWDQRKCAFHTELDTIDNLEWLGGEVLGDQIWYWGTCLIRYDNEVRVFNEFIQLLWREKWNRKTAYWREHVTWSQFKDINSYCGTGFDCKAYEGHLSKLYAESYETMLYPVLKQIIGNVGW